MTSALVQASAIEARGTDAWTPLHLACVSASHQAVTTLVAGGADVNAVAKKNNTPLHLSSEHQGLVEAGA